MSLQGTYPAVASATALKTNSLNININLRSSGVCGTHTTDPFIASNPTNTSAPPEGYSCIELYGYYALTDFEEKNHFASSEISLVNSEARSMQNVFYFRQI